MRVSFPRTRVPGDQGEGWGRCCWSLDIMGFGLGPFFLMAMLDELMHVGSLGKGINHLCR